MRGEGQGQGWTMIELNGHNGEVWGVEKRLKLRT